MKNVVVYSVFFLLIGLILGSDFSSSDYSGGVYWGKNDTTIVLTNGTDNVCIGANETTVHKLYVNGTVATAIHGDSSDWASAFAWGDHSLGGYLLSEVDAVFIGSDAFHVDAVSMDEWNDSYSWGDHSLEGYLVDGEFPSSYSVWCSFSYMLFNNNLKVGDTDAKVTGLWSQIWADAGDNEKWYASCHIDIPIGYKAVVSGFRSVALNGNNNYFDTLDLYAFTSDTASPCVRETFSLLIGVANPFGYPSLGMHSYYTTVINSPPDMYGIDDSSTEIFSDIKVRYLVNKAGGSGGTNGLYDHAVRITYIEL